MALTRRDAIKQSAVYGATLGAGLWLTGRSSIAQTNPWQRAISRAQSLDQCHALAIYQAGRQQVAEVFRGPSIDRVVPIKSVSKTVVAALTGSALDRNEIPSIQSTLGTLAPELIPAQADPRVSEITIEQLVTMQAGLERTSGRNYGAWVSSANWVADALSRPFVAQPGQRMLYSTGSYHVLGAVLARRANQSLLALARSRLGAPLGIDIPPWTQDPQDRYLGGNEMAMTLNGMIRFGEMYRLNGQYNGQQVLSEAWVKQSLQPVTQSPFSGLSYGYGWFLGQINGQRYALARGYGGQIICVMPSLQLTVALTSDPRRPARSGGYFGDIMRLLVQDIVPLAQQNLS